jgi:uncharacterized protein with HEPN domain
MLDRLLLEEMIAAINEISAEISHLPADGWRTEKTKVAAVSMYLVVVGEGAARLSPGMRSLAPDTPWEDIANLRHRLAHAYFRSDPEIVWAAGQVHAPVLRRTAVRLLGAIDQAD